MELRALTPQESHSLTAQEKPLGTGGEGSVYAVKSYSGPIAADELVIKLYHDPAADNRMKKVAAMVAHAVNDESLAWPLAVVTDQHNKFKGYLMKKIPNERYREWLYLSNAKDRRDVASTWDVRYALVSVRNLAVAISSVHEAGHCVGDINESNIFVGTTAGVLIVDTDSMQVRASAEELYPCTVGKPEFTAPELMGGSLRDKLRTPASDMFAFAVAAHQMLTGGATPHAGAFDPQSDDDPMSAQERIKLGVLPGLVPQAAALYGFSPKPGVPTNALPAELRSMLITYLDPDAAKRETLDLHSFVTRLDSIIGKLQQCSKVKLHWYEPQDSCPWCAYEESSGVKPFGVTRSRPKQIELPAVAFDDGEPQQAPRRAAPQIAGPPQLQPQFVPPRVGNSTPPAIPAYQPRAMPQAPQPQLRPPTPRPTRVNGKMVVDYQDGSWGMRPPLASLIVARPRLFREAMNMETPDFLKFWWPVDRKAPSLLGLGTAIVASLAVLSAWFFTLLHFISTMEAGLLRGAATLGLLGVTGVGAVATLFFLITSLVSNRRERKDIPRLALGYEHWAKTLGRGALVGLLYGPPVILIGLIAGVSSRSMR